MPRFSSFTKLFKVKVYWMKTQYKITFPKMLAEGDGKIAGKFTYDPESKVLAFDLRDDIITNEKVTVRDPNYTKYEKVTVRDSIYIKEALMLLGSNELKDICRDLGLKVSGKQQVLRNRILKHQEEQNGNIVV